MQVHVWGLSSEVNSEGHCKEGSSNSNTLMKGVVTLNDYDSEVRCMPPRCTTTHAWQSIDYNIGRFP